MQNIANLNILEVDFNTNLVNPFQNFQQKYSTGIGCQSFNVWSVCNSFFFEIKGRSSATQLSKRKSLEFYPQMAPPGAIHNGPRTQVGEIKSSC